MILEAQGVTKRFGGLVAVNNVTLGVNSGEIFGLIGPNGAGKTTLLNVMSGVYRPERGTVKFEGQDITGLTSHRVCKKGIGRTFQIVRSFPEMSALENVMVAVIFGKDHSTRDFVERRKRAEEALDFVDFPLSKDTLAKNLNTVQLKRLELARALASGPKLLFLDEVAAGLTTGELAELMKIIRKIRDSGITIVTVEHVMRVIMQICDRIAVLHYGEKIAEGTPEEIVNNKKVTEAYLGEKYIL